MLKHEDNLAAYSGTSLQPLAGASVTVTDNATGLPAALYAGNGVTPITQPLTTTDEGYYGFYAADGSYTITFTSPRFATITRQLVLDDPQADPYATRAQLAAPSGAMLVNHNDTPVGDVLDTLIDLAGGGEAYVLPAATIGNLGGVKVGANLAVTPEGILSAPAPYVLPTAAAGVLGGVKVGAGLAIDDSGILSSTAGGAMALLGSYMVGAAVANIDFLNLFTSAYDKYVIELHSLTPSANDGLSMRLAVAGAVDSAANYQNMAGSGNAMASASALALFQSALVNATGTAKGATATIEVRNANGTTGIKTVGLRGGLYTSGAAYESRLLEGAYIGQNAVTGLRLYWTGGANFTAGTVRVYGIKNA